MKRLILFAAFLMLTPFLYAGGLLTNTNQSAQYIRMLSRNASLDVDAVYFNPAGLVYLEDGWHFAAYSQTIFQTKPVDSEFPLLNDGYYEGTVNVPVFPTAFGIYKMDKWAFSLGVGPNAGGGSAVYERGLPSFEIPIAKLGYGLQNISPLLAQAQIPAASGYGADLSFEGSSVFWGIQLGATYAVNEFFSVYGGVRYLMAKNTYLGTIENITVETNAQDPSLQSIAADEYLAMSSMVLEPTISNLNTTSQTLQGAIEAGFIDGDATVSDPQLAAVLGALGQSDLTNQQAVNFMNATSNTLQTINNADVSDKVVDTDQTGRGFTPMVGVNISPTENLNIALKYEMKTTLGLKNEPNEGDNYSEELFGEGVQSDIPAILAAGVGYRNEMIEAQLSYNMYFNKGVDWGPNVRDRSMQREIEKNGMEVALGLQFNVLENFAFSVGGMYGDQGVADSYQSDFSFSNPSFTAGAGVEWKLTDALTVDAGFSNTFYQDQTVTFDDPDLGEYKETYSKTTMNFAVGLSYAIFR